LNTTYSFDSSHWWADSQQYIEGLDQKIIKSKNVCHNYSVIIHAPLHFMYHVQHDALHKIKIKINPQVIQGMLHSMTTPEDTACGQLVGKALFFAMKLCEEMKVTSDCHTKLLCLLENLHFS
jgi:hypothetical protein